MGYIFVSLDCALTRSIQATFLWSPKKRWKKNAVIPENAEGIYSDPE
jgi:hypothetical protein